MLDAEVDGDKRDVHDDQSPIRRVESVSRPLPAEIVLDCPFEALSKVYAGSQPSDSIFPVSSAYRWS